MSCGEKELASQHSLRLQEMGISNDLIIFDRGYASAQRIAQLFESGVHFLMRVRRKFNKEIDALTSSDAFVDLTHEQKVYRMRVVTFPLPSGEVETLITDLPQDTFETIDFQALYFRTFTQVCGKLKHHLVLAVLEPDPNKRERALKKVLAVIAKNRTPIRPGRKFERKTPGKKRFYMNMKSALSMI